MIFPKFLKHNDSIGVVALSAGVGRKLESFDRSLLRLKDYFKIVETASVRIDNVRSNTAQLRAKEFNELINNDDIDLIMIATGGDYLIETLPYINWENIKNKPKFVMGYSDPTFLMYTLTTKYDIATIYGLNAGSFDEDNFHPCLKNALEIMQGNLIEQHSFEKFEANKDFESSSYNLDTAVKWININSNKIDESGILIGGCLDVIANLIGTNYDGTKEFIKRYPQGLIWFFDIYEMSANTLYMTILQMKNAGYFETSKAIIIGRILFTNGSTEQEYLDLLTRTLNIPIVFNADIGHTTPTMTFISGAKVHLISKDGKGVIKQWV